MGWLRVARELAEVVPPPEIDRIWLFPPVRMDEREWGTAVVSRRGEGDRRRIYTASYILVARGRDRGQGRVVVEEVGDGPESVVREIIAGVQARAGETEPPFAIAPEEWYPTDHDEPPTEG
jgi:hypothetical protein